MSEEYLDYYGEPLKSGLYNTYPNKSVIPPFFIFKNERELWQGITIYGDIFDVLSEVAKYYIRIQSPEIIAEDTRILTNFLEEGLEQIVKTGTINKPLPKITRLGPQKQCS